jgi:hypothetical protein
VSITWPNYVSSMNHWSLPDCFSHLGRDSPFLRLRPGAGVLTEYHKLYGHGVVPEQVADERAGWQ